MHRLVPILACAASGCSLLVDVAGLTGGTEPAPAPTDDGGAPRVDAAGGGAIGDAALDDGDGDGAIGDGGSSSSCGALLFADDFDDGALGATWDSAVASAGVTNALVAEHLSAPNGFSVTVDPSSPPASGYLRKSFGTRKAVCLGMSIAVAATNTVELFEVSGPDYRLTLTSESGSFGLTESIFADGANIHRGVATFSPLGGWRRLRFELEFPPGAGKGTVRVLVDDVLTATKPIGDTPYDLTVSALKFGVTYANTSSSKRSLIFDDVAIATK